MTLSTTVHWWYLVFKKIRKKSEKIVIFFFWKFVTFSLSELFLYMDSVDDIHTDKNITIAVNENGTEWKPIPKNETEDNHEGSGITEEGNT